MAKWNSSPHPISDLRDWHTNKLLELQPAFQRQEVWSQAARNMLIDTILRGIPMPKIFLANRLQKTHTYRVVIDGQQRTTAILDFLADKFPLDDPYDGEHKGKTFSQLDEETQNQILSYQIDFNEAINPSDQETREVYSRVNKYTVALTKQELRRADFPGDFLNVSEELANHAFLDSSGIFTAANRRRYADVEYVSELLAGLLSGAQDKKKSLDDYYKSLVKWPKDDRKKIERLYTSTLDEIALLFRGEKAIDETRFKQKADFYSLFLAVSEFAREGLSLRDKNIGALQEDFDILDYNIRPEGDIPILSEYAIKCVSQANSHASRKWRQDFLSAFLRGTYRAAPPNEPATAIFYAVMDGLSIEPSGMCPDPVFECPQCNLEIRSKFDGCVLAWRRDLIAFQVSNATWAHAACVEGHADYVHIARPTTT